jgi:hypothetical protein
MCRQDAGADDPQHLCVGAGSVVAAVSRSPRDAKPGPASLVDVVTLPCKPTARLGLLYDRESEKSDR